MTINVGTLQFDEVLQKVNDSVDPAPALKEILTDPYIRQYLTYMVSDSWSKVDVDTVGWENMGLYRSEVGAYLLNRITANTIKEVIMNDAVKLHTQKYQLKSILEMLYIGESNVLIAILKKNLSELYPNITFEMIAAAL